MDHSAEFRRCLEAMDVEGARRIWSHVSPHLPMPATESECIASMHMARTAAESIEFDKRAYSHRWLSERNYPSQLPDALKPKAERIYPKIVEGVLISVNFSAPEMKPAADFIRGEMEDSVQQSYADGETDHRVIRDRMLVARTSALKKAFGSFYRHQETLKC